MSFQETNLRQCYDSGREDILNDFYIPILRESIEYKRLAGFFSSSALAVAARGIRGLLENDGKMKLIAGAILRKEYIEELTSIRTKIETLGKNINSLENEKHLLKEKKSKIEKIIKELEEKIVCIEEDSTKINICTKIIDSLKEFTNTVISSKIEELEKIITNMYCKLANKDDMVKEIKIDPKTFTTTLIDFEGGTANKENISTGEKEIYALSVLWGLSKISKRKLPLIVDSPLARLDKSHAEKIIKNFFPNAGEQVIILSHDKEIDKGLYEKLKPYINKSYMLSLGEENKINKGYFFD